MRSVYQTTSDVPIPILILKRCSRVDPFPRELEPLYGRRASWSRRPTATTLSHAAPVAARARPRRPEASGGRL